MCGRCRHVFNAFESLQRKLDSVGGTIETETSSKPVPVALNQPHHLPEILPSVSSGAALASADETGKAGDSGTGNLNTNVRNTRGFIPVEISSPENKRATAMQPAQSGQDRNASVTVFDIDPLDRTASAWTYQTPAATPITDTALVAGSDEIIVVAPRSADPFLPAQDESQDSHNRAGYAVETGNPLLVADASDLRTSPARPRIWLCLAALSFIALAAQLLYLFRTEVIDQYPQLRPYFASACETLGCTLPWKRDESAIEITDSSLIEVPGKPGRILLTALLTNRSKSKQDYPVIKLELTDNNNQPLVRRLLRPADYVGRPLLRDDGLAANAELYVNLSLDVGNKSRASGYGLKPLYP